MPAQFEQPLQVFMVHIDEVRQSISFVREAVRIKAILGKVVRWEVGKTHETELISSFIGREPLIYTPVINGLFVTVIAAFEEFLRSVIAEGARIKAEKAQDISELGQSFVNRHMEYSGRLLALVHSPPAHLAVNFYDICRKLGTCIPDSTSFEVNDLALSMVKGVMEIETFIGSMNDMGYNLSLDSIGSDRDLQNLLKTKKVRETANILARSISNAIKNRHKIAHSGQSFAEITPEILDYNLTFLALVAGKVVENLKK